MEDYSPVVFSGAKNQLQKYFDVKRLKASTLPELEQQIASVVGNLLRTDLNKLLHILYRIDVDEHQVKIALTSASEEEVAFRIARLIIKRELQKVQTRFIIKQR
ncbi:hypothetical protein [Botryobacter ruber]|uniref:hypothetical protein n=1 Tax=Botryobacter ruber TaxID=2171629 RepID=UPI000E0C5003|nr:hypothetical protein [Botryobacter ruber]